MSSLLNYCFKESGETFFNILVSIKNDQRAVSNSKLEEKKKKKEMCWEGGPSKLGSTAPQTHCPCDRQRSFTEMCLKHTTMILRNRHTFHDKLLLYSLAVQWLSDMAVFKDLFGSQSKLWHSVFKKL